jgi:hypothetical protein
MNPQQCSEREQGLAPRIAGAAAHRKTGLRRFSAPERERLRRLRQAVDRGERSDSFPVDRRQDFVRWLIAQGRLSDD